MLYNESPVYDYSVVTSVLNDGNFCWGAVLGVCEPAAPDIPCAFSVSLLSRRGVALKAGGWAKGAVSPHVLSRWLKF